jgi:energy-coupling factor transporter transmembrane protein EcfT
MHDVDKPRTLDPRLRVLYLVAAAVGVFFLHRLWEVAALVVVQGALWLGVGLGAKRLVRQVSKLWGFALFILVSFALTSEDPTIDRWIPIHVFGYQLPLKLNIAGMLVGVVMVLRVLQVILASQVARAGDGRAIAAGLDKLYVPKIIAVSIDAVLALLGEEGMGRGRGGGGGGGGGRGGGRGRRGDGEALEPGGGFWASVKRLARGDVGRSWRG